jgi:hypothetical protein
MTAWLGELIGVRCDSTHSPENLLCSLTPLANQSIKRR